MKLVYLAGGIDGHSYDSCNGWREYAIQELALKGITGLSPMRSKDFLRNYTEIVDGVSQHVLASDSGITARDMWDVRRSDAVLFNLLEAKKVSIGTMIEYGWASSFDKPIITLMEKQGNIHEHAMVRRLSDYRV